MLHPAGGLMGEPRAHAHRARPRSRLLPGVRARPASRFIRGDATTLAIAPTAATAVDTISSHAGNSMMPKFTTPQIPAAPVFENQPATPACTQTPIGGSQDTRNLGTHKRRASLLRGARAVQWFGILWNVGCAAFALWTLLNNDRFSDAVADATPLVLIGGMGFVITWGIAGIFKIRAGSKIQSVAGSGLFEFNGAASSERITALEHGIPRWPPAHSRRMRVH